ncbi:uncharacterized protein EV422DRAFT_518723 [Fimicolochytrium jonesii]|uniref:uncharacterized protein n=1 Tax=Fimicolochytrium jonesii TaxID=1396493 RepID=UPI0022FEFCCB|nr:uncharacterized protein EV422DRAFT_518723 [Fimicolochytrium jonesii]KAI8824050.1 hypothetical protein EV422DRAFT_518723 [Fimicolochytrium jonesii]
MYIRFLAVAGEVSLVFLAKGAEALVLFTGRLPGDEAGLGAFVLGFAVRPIVSAGVIQSGYSMYGT